MFILSSLGRVGGRASSEQIDGFTVKGAFKRFGLCPHGMLGLCNDLADGICRAGGDIWLNAPVNSIKTQSGLVTGVAVVKDGVKTLASFGKTRRLWNEGALTATGPKLAPASWYQCVAYAVPRPAIGNFDQKTEIDASLQDLRDEFPGFAQAKMLSIRVMRDGWKAQRSCAGFDMPQTTPAANLWQVGDAVKDYGDGGTQAGGYTGLAAARQAVAHRDGARVVAAA